MTEVTPEVTPEVKIVTVLLHKELSRKDLQSTLSLRDADYFRETYLNPALEQKLIEMTIPDKPQSSKQRYRLTAKGRKLATASEGH